MKTTRFSALTALLSFFVLATPAAAEVVLGCAANGGSNCQGTIPDFPISSPYVSSFTAPSASCAGVASGVGIRVNVIHNHTGDLTLSVSGPGGNTVLFNQPLGIATGGCAGDDISATFANSGGSANSCSDASIPGTSGTLLPVSGGAALNLGNTSGLWTLTVTDNSNGFEGFVQDWSVVALCDARLEIVPTQSPFTLVVILLALAGLGVAGFSTINRRRKIR